MADDPSILLVGCGSMGGAMLTGWIGQGRGPAVTVLTRTAARVPPGIRAFAADAAPGSAMPPPRVAVLAVKPQMLATAAPAVAPLVGPDTLLLSVLAAVEIATLRRFFPAAKAVARAVPNLPAAIGAGVTALAGEGLAPHDRQLLTDLCRPLGTVEWLDGETALDGATAVSGCGPAFLFRFADAVTTAGVAQGLSAAEARRLFAQTMIGAGRMLETSDLSPGEMARRVASPGGVTLSGLAVLDRGDALSRLVGDTLRAAARRNAEMAAASRDD